jgi:hypothetical protein
MAKKEEQKKTAPETKVEAAEEDFAVNNMLGDKAIVAAMEEIEKEEDQKKKSEAKEALMVATYNNVRTLLELRQRRREDKITKKKLERTKDLLERLIGVRCEIKDGGKLVPTKTAVPAEDRITPTQYKAMRRELNEEIRKDMREASEQFDKEYAELKNSYAGQWRYYWDD